MNRGRLRRYALRVVAAVSLGVGAIVIAGGVAQASTSDTSDTTYGRTLTVQETTDGYSASEISWG
jgi:hypothetical protein